MNSARGNDTATPPGPAVRVEGLTKAYDGRRVVDGVSFTVARGEIFGMLGPNGAGKTTTVEILEGLRTADGGIAEVLGLDVRREPRKVKQRIGVATQASTLMPNLTARELLDTWGALYPRSLRPDALLERLGLTDKRDARVETLSGGQQQRLSIALALVGDPELVFLDEPTTGLDPQARRGLWDVIADLRASGKTVVLTTHYMDEAERLCDRIGIMDHGRLLSLDTPAGLIRAHFAERVVRFAAATAAGTPARPDDWADLPGVVRAYADEDGSGIALQTASVQTTLPALFERAEARGVALGEMRVQSATLEDVFLKLTGHSLRD